MPEYKFKGTADFSQHDRTLKNSANKVYDYKKQVESAKKGIGDFAKKFGPLAGQIGLAVGAMDMFKRAITATEKGSDAFDRTLYTLKSSVNHFYASLTNGTGLQSFLRDLDDIKDAARAAFNALDDLDTAKMWKNNRIKKLQADIAENLVVVNDPTASASDRKKAQQDIKVANEKIKALSVDLIEYMQNAYYTMISELAGGNLTRATADWLMRSREEDNGKAIREKIKQLESKYKTEKTWQTIPGGSITGYQQGYWDVTWQQTAEGKKAERVVTALQNFLTNTDKNGIAPVLDIQSQINDLRIANANMERKTQKSVNKNVDGGKKSDKPKLPEYETGSIADLKAQLAEIDKKLENQVLSEEEINNLMLERNNLVGDIDYYESLRDSSQEIQGELEGEIDMWDAVTKAYKQAGLDRDEILKEQEARVKWHFEQEAESVKVLEDALKHLEDVASEFGDAFGSFGEIFESINEIFYEGESTALQYFSKISSGIGKLIPQLMQIYTANQAAALAQGISSASGLMFPYNLAAIATVVSTILATFASLPKFADGGIVGGNLRFGDRNIARVNAGEMILNGSQQRNLFAMLNNGNTSASGQNVTFTLRGEELVGLINNTMNRKNRVV